MNMQNLISKTLSRRFFPLKNFQDNFKDPGFLFLKEYLTVIAAKLSELFPEDKYYAKAYTGNGRMPLVPWVGLHSKKEGFNSKPETGLYLTLLWHADGSGVCLSFQKGSDKSNKTHLSTTVELIRKNYDLSEFDYSINLKAPPKSKRPENYQNAHIAGHTYSKTNINNLQSDILRLESFYDQIVEDNPTVHFGSGPSDIALLYEKTYSTTFDRKTLDKRVKKLRSLKGRQKATGNEKPRSKIVQSKEYERDPAVKAEVLDRAKGLCEYCYKRPFLTYDREPYLEVHHIIPLSEGGPDTVKNTIALCPECHRAAHHAVDRQKITSLMQQTLDQPLMKIKELNENQIRAQLSRLSVEDRIEAIKSCILHAEHRENIHISVEPISETKALQLNKFPKDFQFFVKEIGLIDVGTQGCAELEVILPDPSLECFDFSEEGLPYYNDGYGYWGFDKNYFTTHLPVVTWPCSYHSAGYDLSKTPHEFVVFSDPDFSELNIRSFLEFVEYSFVTDCYLWIFFLDAHQKNFSI